MVVVFSLEIAEVIFERYIADGDVAEEHRKHGINVERCTDYRAVALYFLYYGTEIERENIVDKGGNVGCGIFGECGNLCAAAFGAEPGDNFFYRGDEFGYVAVSLYVAFRAENIFNIEISRAVIARGGVDFVINIGV